FLPIVLTTTTSRPAILPLSLHDALPIWARDRGRFRLRGTCHRCRARVSRPALQAHGQQGEGGGVAEAADQASQIVHPVHGLGQRDRKSTRLNSSHVSSSYAVFCLKKKSR